MEPAGSTPRPFWRTVYRALRLRCPGCGQGRLYAGLFSMHAECEECHAKLARDPGFYLGAIYFNYGLTALVITVVYVLLWVSTELSTNARLMITLAIAVALPLLFFRFARSLWLGFDYYIDPSSSD